jgi:hypothetical protein
VVGGDIGVADVREWSVGLDELADLIGPRFRCSESRQNAVGYVRGLLSERERKNSWTISELAGQAVPDPLQWLLWTADWDPDLVRDDLRSYVVERLGDRDGVLVVDETGFLKKGDRSAGVARQHTGTAGRIENAQVGVFLTYSTSRGRTFLDPLLAEVLDRRPGSLRTGWDSRAAHVRHETGAGDPDACPRERWWGPGVLGDRRCRLRSALPTPGEP